jgi:hypothetical protein
VRFSADRAEGDPTEGAVTLEGHVVVTFDRYRLESDRISLAQRKGEVDIDGDARLSLCPCPKPPVSIGLSGAKVVGGGDLVLRWPRIYLGPVPIFVLPRLWIRAPDRIGLLPPVVALRGADGLLLGTGMRVPWRGEDEKARAFEVRAAGYVQGGVELSARLETPTSTGRVVWDRLGRDRIVVDAHGSFRAGSAREAFVAWDVDAIRGPRGLRATVPLALAAQPYDVGAIETSVRIAPGGGAGGIVATGVRARARRGEGALVAGPVAVAAASGALGRAGAWEASLVGTALAGGGTRGATPMARAAIAIEENLRPGPLDVRMGARGRARLVASREPVPVAWDAAAEARAEARLPLVRVFDAKRGEAPLVHWIAPLVEARAAVSERAGTFFQTLRTEARPALGLGALGVSSSLGRAFGSGLGLETRVGLVGAGEEARLAAWGRIEAASDALGGARVEAAVERALETGVALAAQAWIGRQGGALLAVEAYGQAGSAAALARAIGPDAWLLGDTIGMYADAGFSLAAEARTPALAGISAGARADVDARTGALAGVKGSLGYRHPSGCAAVEIGGSQRAGRPGVDLWMTIDLVPPLPAPP